MMANWGDERLPGTFWDRVIPEPNSGCWLWLGGGSGKRGDYGKTVFDGRLRFVHRIAYQALTGPIEPGLVIDHLCRTPRCCNPQHLEAVTMGENTARGLMRETAAARARAKTHCKRGHPLSGGNLRIKNGTRNCRICIRALARAIRQARAAAATAAYVAPPERTHCKRGHELSGPNIFIVKYGPNKDRICKTCRTCKNDETRRRRARAKLSECSP